MMNIVIVRDKDESEEAFRKRIELTSLTMENQHHYTEGIGPGKELQEAVFCVYED